MKYFKFILPLIFILFSCTTDSVQTPENTQLELTIKDENNSPVENSEVKLYASQDDMNNGVNIVQTLTTDVNGKVTFQDLQAIKYFWGISKQCYADAENNSIDPIISNTLNTFSTSQPTNNVGYISILNNTVNEYSFTINGPSPSTTDAFNIMPNTPTLLLYEWEIGTYSYSYTQVGSSTITTSSFVLDCGETKYIVIN
jgi:hypothetical protein